MEKSYLKDRQEYLDRYDRMTVEHCRSIEKIHNRKDPTPKKGKGITKKQMEGLSKWTKDMHIYFTTGERYLEKFKTVEEWMASDRAKDELYESAQPPADVRCLMCRNRVVPTFKQLWYGSGKTDRVLFMFDCPNGCLPRRAYFSDGEEYRTKPHLCPKCSTPTKNKTKESKEKIVTTYTCPRCKHTETEDYEFSKPEEEKIDKDYPVDRDRFCLTDEEGMKYADGKRNLESLSVMMKEFEEEKKAQEEQLKENPEGFAVKRNSGSCPLCGQYEYGQDIEYWYDKWGIKCLVCQKAIDRKEIPGSLIKLKDSWYSSWELQRRFNIKAPTISKWVRQGILKARTISRYGKGVQAHLFLTRDNEDFLPPKKFTESRGYSYPKDGKTWHTTAEWYCYADLRKKVEKYKIMNYIKIVEVEKKTD
jgi:hypothetical protein